MPNKLVEIASGIVQAQASKTPMTAADIASSLRRVFSTLHELQRAESGEIELPKIQEAAPVKALSPEDSIQNDKVVCLECVAEMRQLNKHLALHGMSAEAYKKKYGFTMRTTLAAKSLRRARSKAAKKRGLPEKLQKYIEARRQAKAKASKPAATERVPTSKPMAAEAIQKSLRKKKPALTPENSIQDDKIICLECGAGFKQLTQKHLVSHGLSPNEYKKKYGFSMETPLFARSVTRAMSEIAKGRGRIKNLQKAVEARKQEKTKAPATESIKEGPGAERVKRVRNRFSPKKVE